MKTRLFDVVDEGELDALMEAGYVRQQTHPSLPLAILNYTQRCQYDAVWSATSRACRGLIYDVDTMEVVARPFPKFHNYGEHLTPSVGGDLLVLDLHAPAVVTDKLDGSLGILYPTGYEDVSWAIATRGSFTSEQALHATDLLISRYLQAGWYPAHPHWTYLFEIVYPANRVVVDYGDRDELVLLDVLDTNTGRPIEHQGNVWQWERAERHAHTTLAEALAAEPRPGAEGLVVYLPDANLRVKLKQDEYVALHRILTGTNARNVWEVAAVHACRDRIKDPKHWGSFLGMDPARAEEVLALGDGWLDAVPDEFHDWVREVTSTAERRVAELLAEANDLILRAGVVESRAERYALLSCHPLVTEIMRYLGASTPEAQEGAADGLLLRCWREATPEPTSPFARDEAIA